MFSEAEKSIFPLYSIWMFSTRSNNLRKVQNKKQERYFKHDPTRYAYIVLAQYCIVYFWTRGLLFNIKRYFFRPLQCCGVQISAVDLHNSRTEYSSNWKSTYLNSQISVSSTTTVDLYPGCHETWKLVPQPNPANLSMSCIAGTI